MIYDANLKSITSAQNPLFRQWQKILKTAGIKKEHKLFLMGEKIIHDYLELNGYGQVQEFVTTDSLDIATFKKYPIKGYKLPNKLFAELDVFNTNYPLLTIHPPQINTWDSKTQPSQLEVILPFQDPSNLGAAIRTATAFNASKVILLKESAYPFHPKSMRTSSGTVLQAPLFEGPSIEDLTGNFITLDTMGLPMQDFRWPQHIRILVGEEGRGIPVNLNTEKINIPIHENCESLNAAIAISLAMYSYRLRFPQ